VLEREDAEKDAQLQPPEAKRLITKAKYEYEKDHGI
jgi:hypothetical protein